jgi:uncharacterized membrane protein
VTERRLRWAIAALGACGLAIAAYLTYVHYAGLHSLCLSGSGGCERVQTSPQSRFAGVPVAVLGLAGYALIIATALLRRDAGRTGGALFALAGLGMSAYLTYEELFRIHAVCPWCVASAVVMTALAGLACARLLRASPAT